MRKIYFLYFSCVSGARDHFLILNILFFNKLRKIIPEVRSEMRDLLIFIFILKTTGTFTLVLVTPRIFLFDIGVRVTAESMFLMAAAIAYRYSHLSKGNDAQHRMKACLKWVIGTVHVRYICLSLLVILEVEDITRKCTFGHITKPEALKSLYRSPGNKKKQLVLCKNYVLQW